MELKKAKNINWIIVLLISFFVSEAIYKLLVDLKLSEIRIAGVVKLIAQLFMAFVIFKNYKVNKTPLVLTALLCLLYCVGQISLKDNSHVIHHLEYLNNAIFVIITLLFYNGLDLSREQKKSTLKYFEIIVIINSLAAILGFLLSIKYFETYQWKRFGYDGFLVKSSYASYFYLVSVFYFIHQVFILKKKKIIFLIVVTFAAILTGTKATILFIFLCFFYVLFRTKAYLKKKFIIAVSAFGFGAFLCRNYIKSFVFPVVDFFSPIVEEHGIYTALFSFRNLILQNELLPYIHENWRLPNYLFGGMGNIMIKSGFDFIDLFYFFGAVGSILYLFILFRVFYLKNIARDYVYFFILLAIVMSLGGNLFYNSSVAILLCIVKIYFELIKEDEGKPT